MKGVLGLFLDLAQRLTPAGHEYTLYRYLPTGYTVDTVGNAFVCIGDDPQVLFCSHLDTFPVEPEAVHVDIRWKGGVITTGGLTNLGADDKAGVAILLDMIQNQVPGLYGFFVREEQGCVGSRYAVGGGELLDKYPSVEAVVAFDRRGTGSVITHQRGIRMCSSAVARRLCSALNRSGLKYYPDALGGYCDSASFHGKGNIEVCTNLSVGYFDEHTCVERLDVDHLLKLASLARKLDWHEALGI